MGNKKALSNWEKLKLLSWKNWILQWSRKWEFVLALIIPIVFLSLIVVMRGLIVPENKEGVDFNPVSITSLTRFMNSIMGGNQVYFSNGSLNLPKSILAYSPKNKIYDQILYFTVTRLRIMDFKAYKNAEELENALISENILAGVQFDDGTKDITDFPNKFSFALRFPSELRTARGQQIHNWRTNFLYPIYDMPGPRNVNSSDGGIPCAYVQEGFLPIQNALVMTYLWLASKGEYPPLVDLKRYPSPDYIYDPLLTGLHELMPLLMVLSFIYPSSFIAKYVTHEKEKQLKEIMKILGLHNWLHWAAWFIKSFLMLFVISCIIVFLLKWRFEDAAVFNYCSWSVLLFFLVAYITATICFCFMLAVFFGKASSAAAFTGVFLLATYLAFTFAMFHYESIPLGVKMMLCLVTNGAMGLGLKVISAYEGFGVGSQWNNILEPISPDDSLTLFYVILMLYLGSIIYMILCLYIEQIFPGEYGVPKKWYYPFKSESKSSKEKRRATGGSELDLTKHDVGVSLRNLKKKFGNHMAVKGLTFDMFVNEITVLLGHNGAGKTTTIMMLIGIIPPTEGTAIVNGCDIRKELECARHSLGICPQHNVLFDDMSVRNHIVFFSCLKGVRGKDAINQEVEKYLEIMDLGNRSGVPASTLSGGMKRKLSLCTALCGDTKTVLCDEPSSGVDPAARRQLWDMLQSEKTGRTVLLTTHFMDEADVLGDRIVIMSGGQLQCHGTPLYLKKLYGSGYHLICEKEKDCKVADVTKLLHKYILDIQPASDIGTELSYRLPFDYAQIYAEMLKDLEEKSKELHIGGFGLSMATLEEVFMRVGAEQHKDVPKSKDFIFSKGVGVTSSVKHCCFQWRAMFMKKCLITLNNWKFFIVQVLIPVVFMLLTCLNAQGSEENVFLPPLIIDFEKYSRVFALLEVKPDVEPDSITASFAKEYQNYAESKGIEFKNTDQEPVLDYVLKIAKDKYPYFQKTCLVGATISEYITTVWLNNKPLHTAPLTLNAIHNAFARALIGPDAEVQVTNAPIPFNNNTLASRLKVGSRVGIEISVNLSICFCFVTAFYALPLIKENRNRSNLLQFVSGASVYAYWFSHLIWDLLTFTLICVLTLITIACFQEAGFAKLEDLLRYQLLLLIFGLSVLPLTYLLSFLFSDGANGYSMICIFNFFTGVGFFVVIVWFSFEEFELEDIKEGTIWYFRFFPHFCLASGLHQLHINYEIREACESYKFQTLTDDELCEAMQKCCKLPDYFDWEEPGILPETMFLLVTGLIYFILLLYGKIILGWLNAIRGMQCKKRKRSKGGSYRWIDEDVFNEANRIEDLSDDERDDYPLVLDRVGKTYRTFTAVESISFTVNSGECFGLLGVNGAGKTTTFKMLTGDVKISSGNAYVKGLSLRTQMHKVHSHIGYCPQFDALFDDLTGRQTMKIYCLLHGVQTRYINQISEELAKAFGFMKHMDKQTKNYSGGNQRKLSTALTLLGDPTVIYLDEPTSGMDPAARRQLWNMICHIREMGKSVVLTSHSMEECEALCTKLAIMVNGQFKCMGSTQHLKNKFSDGLVLKIKISKEYNEAIYAATEIWIEQQRRLSMHIRYQEHGWAQESSSDIDSGESITDESFHSDDSSTFDLKEFETIEKHEFQLIYEFICSASVRIFIEDNIPNANLNEEYQGLLTYHIPLRHVKWSDIFHLIESNLKHLNIEDYCISQTTLEEIFLEFAKSRHRARGSSYMKPRKWWRCRWK